MRNRDDERVFRTKELQKPPREKKPRRVEDDDDLKRDVGDDPDLNGLKVGSDEWLAAELGKIAEMLLEGE